MATFGNTTAETEYNVSLEDNIAMGRFTMPENGVANSITCYFSVSTLWEVTYKFAIYLHSDGSLVGQTVGGFAEMASGWKTLNISGTVNLTGGSDYLLAAWVQNEVGVTVLGRLKGTTGLGVWEDPATYGTWPDPHAGTESVSTGLMSIYCTYTASAVTTRLLASTGVGK